MLCRPCVDCGRYTGCYCDGDELGISGRPCLASDRVPGEAWAVSQRTPLSAQTVIGGMAFVTFAELEAFRVL